MNNRSTASQASQDRPPSYPTTPSRDANYANIGNQPRRRYRYRSVIHWVLAFIIGVVLLANVQEVFATIGSAFLPISVYSLLTMLAILFSVPLIRGRLSVAHAIGMLAFLSQDASIFPAMTWGIFIGSLFGGLIWLMAGTAPVPSAPSRTTYRTVIFTTARITLSFFAAGSFYLAMNAPLPINSIDTKGLLENAFPLLLYTMVYLLMYFAIFALQEDAESHAVRYLLQDSILAIGTILVLPVPFAVVAAGVARIEVSPVFFVITAIGAVLTMSGLYAMARSEQHTRRQLHEMQTLAIATQAIRGTLSMQQLVRITYTQIINLIPVNDFVVALYDELNDSLYYPLIIKDGEEISTQRQQPPVDKGLIRHIILTRQAHLISSNVTARAHAWGIALDDDAHDLTSWLGVPITVGDIILGAFILQSRDDNQHFTISHLRLMNIFAASASIAIENARLYNEQETRAEQLATLSQITALLTQSLAPNEVLDTIVSSASTISDAKAVAVYLQDEHAPLAAPKLAGVAGLSETTVTHIQHPLIPTAPSEGQLIAPPRYIRDMKHVQLRPAVQNALLSDGIQALIELPLIIGHEELGTIGLYFDRVQRFDVAQIDLLQAYSTQAAQAIANAYSYTDIDQALEKRVEQIYALATLGRLVNATLDEERIHNTILDYARSGTESDEALLLMFPEDNNPYVTQATGSNFVDWQNPTALNFMLETMRQNKTEPIRINNAQSSSATDSLARKMLTVVSQDDLNAFLIMPLMRGDMLQGILWLGSLQANAYNDSDVQYIAQVAYQATTAIDNTRLFQRIREHRDNLQVILNAMEEAILVIDDQQKIAMVNPRIASLGLNVGDLLHQPVADLINDTQLNFCHVTGFRPEEVHNLLETLQAQKLWRETSHQYTLQQDSHSPIHIQRQIIPLPDEHGQAVGALLVFYNKTEEHELERARDSFSQMIVHDLRSPLTAVTTSLRLINEIVPHDAEYRSIVDKTISNSNRALRKVLNRVNALLDIAKIESGEMNLDREPTALLPILRNIISELDPLALELGIAIGIESPPDLPYLYVDADKTERMLLNLVDNALKYSPMDSTIRIHIHEPILKPDQENFLQVDVIDRGAGIPDEYKPRLFDRFVQVAGRRSTRHSVGLGLTFCKLVVEAHGGQIGVADNPDGGSIFSVQLPIVSLQALEDDD
jgi:NtrC-family two-component system sensor histidine kinase KinB